MCGESARSIIGGNPKPDSCVLQPVQRQTQSIIDIGLRTLVAVVIQSALFQAISNTKTNGCCSPAQHCLLHSAIKHISRNFILIGVIQTLPPGDIQFWFMCMTFFAQFHTALFLYTLMVWQPSSAHPTPQSSPHLCQQVLSMQICPFSALVLILIGGRCSPSEGCLKLQ